MNRIKQLREERGLTQADLGKMLHVKGAAISKYENEKIPLTTETIKKLSDLFGVPTDYLLGTSNSRGNADITTSVHSSERINEKGFFFFFFDTNLRDTFKSRFEASLENKKMNVKSFSKISEINLDTCKDYLEGIKEPSLEDLVQISCILEVSTDYLLGNTDSSISALSADEEELLEYYNTLNKMDQRWILGQIIDLLKKQEEGTHKSVAEDEEPIRKASGK